MTIYDRPVWKLVYDMVQDLGLTEGHVVSRDQVIAWFRMHYPRIKDSTVSAHLIRLSTNAPSRIHYGAKPRDDDLFFKLDGSHFRLYDSATDPPPIYKRPGQTAVRAGTNGVEDEDDKLQMRYSTPSSD